MAKSVVLKSCDILHRDARKMTRDEVAKPLTFLTSGYLEINQAPEGCLAIICENYISPRPSDEVKNTAEDDPAHNSSGSEANSPLASNAVPSASASLSTTPESITDELTRVPSPQNVRKSLNNSLLTDAKKHEKIETISKKLTNGHSSKSGTSLLSVKDVFGSKKETSKMEKQKETCRGEDIIYVKSKNTPEKTRVIGPQLPPGYDAEKNGSARPDSAGDRRRENEIREAVNGNDSNVRLERKRAFPKDDFDFINFTWNDLEFSKKLQHGCGLQNGRNDCFINSVMQFFIHTPQLVRLILRKNHRCNNSNGNCVFCVLFKHYERVSRGFTCASPKDMRFIVNCLFPNRIANNQEDAHEMLIFMLTKLEPNLTSRLNAAGEKIRPEPTDIDKIFGGKLRSKLFCERCSYETISSEEVRELNISLVPQCGENLFNYVDNFFQAEQIREYKCDQCGLCGASRKFYILKAPNILIIQLKRFRHNSTKNSSPISVPLTLDLSKFSARKENIRYRLYGFISHSGSTTSSGHYTAVMKGFDSNWYFFDDESVTPRPFRRGGDSDPYILFFHRESSSPSQQPPWRATNGNSLAKKSSQLFCNKWN